MLATRSEIAVRHMDTNLLDTDASSGLLFGQRVLEFANRRRRRLGDRGCGQQLRRAGRLGSQVAGTRHFEFLGAHNVLHAFDLVFGHLLRSQVNLLLELVLHRVGVLGHLQHPVALPFRLGALETVSGDPFLCEANLWK